MRFGSLSDLSRSLTARLLALLTLALMPLGAIAVYQTSALSEQLRQERTATLLASSELAVVGYRKTLQRAFGASEAVASLVSPLIDTPQECDAELARVVDLTNFIEGLSVVAPDGTRLCGTLDLGWLDDLALEEVGREGRVFADGPEEGGLSFLIGHPVLRDGAVSHVIVLSTPVEEIESTTAQIIDNAPSGLLVFSAEGRRLTTFGKEPGEAFLSVDDPDVLEQPQDWAGRVYSDHGPGSTHKTFSIVPVFRDVVYAMATWDEDEVAHLRSQSAISPWLLPLAMWLATVTVAYIAISQLVVRHARDLGDRMRRFAEDRTLPDITDDDDQPDMFREMNLTFRTMSEAVVQDEARLEDAVREKTMLIREVHHRVKNNLQLIASIMNMQIRRNRDSEASGVIRRIQDRVLGLAAVHRRMYEAESIIDIPADDLLRDIANQLLLSNPRFSTGSEAHFVPLRIGPDQSVPLALLAAEAIANAAKYAGAEEGEHPWAKAALSRLDTGDYELTVENSLGPEGHEQRKSVTQGLGMQLIKGFVTQLDGKLDIAETPDSYRLSVSFPVRPVEVEPGNVTL